MRKYTNHACACNDKQSIELCMECLNSYHVYMHLLIRMHTYVCVCVCVCIQTDKHTLANVITYTLAEWPMFSCNCVHTIVCLNHMFSIIPT